MRDSDLPRLAQTNKVFQIAAEKQLYHQLYLGKPEVAFACLGIISNTERIGLYVNNLYIYQATRRWHNRALPLPFWQTLQAAMKKMCNLELLYIQDATGENTFILDPAELNFRVREAQLFMDLDENMATFLNRQHHIERLQLSDEASQMQIKPNALPCLQQFSGSLSVAVQLTTRPLTHLQIRFEEASTPASLDNFIASISNKMHLISLNLLEIPHGHSINALQLIANTCPNLKYLGCLSFPSREVSQYKHNDDTDLISVLEAQISQTSCKLALSTHYRGASHELGAATHGCNSKDFCVRASCVLSIPSADRILGGRCSLPLGTRRRQLDLSESQPSHRAVMENGTIEKFRRTLSCVIKVRLPSSCPQRCGRMFSCHQLIP